MRRIALALGMAFAALPLGCAFVGINLVPMPSPPAATLAAGPTPTPTANPAATSSPSASGSAGGQVAAGQSLFSSKNCAGCHGASGQGQGSFPKIAGKTASDLSAVVNGSGTMATMFKGQLSADDIANLGAYLQQLPP